LHRRPGRGAAAGLLRRRARGGRPRRNAVRRQPVHPAEGRGAGLHREDPLPHRRRRDADRRRPLRRDHRRPDHRRDRRDPHHRARGHPRRRQDLRGRDGRPETGRVLLMTQAPTFATEAPAEATELLRFATAGSVDDGKSTLIGRLLYDTKTLFEDQWNAVEAVSAGRGDEYTDLALLTDGLRSEREQGITIDVAYR